MGEVARIYPEGKTGLINWIERNFHDIDSFVVTFHMKDEACFVVYHTDTYVEAMGLTGVQQNTLHEIWMDGNFKAKPKT